MYRLILALLLCACAVRSAPRDDEPQPAASEQPVSGAGSEEGSGGVTAGAADGDEPAGPAEAEAGAAPRTPARAFTRAPRPATARPRFISKLSYFNRANAASDGETNLLERPGKGYRKFTSSCRCEKIWNCPRLQITVPRCPDEYFLCCDL